MFKTITLKLSPRLQARIAREARSKGKTIERWMLEAMEREIERRERFVSYVRTAQRAELSADPVEEMDARQQVRFWLERLSSTHPGSNVTRLRPRTRRAPRISR